NERLIDLMYPADHPYHHSVIGSMEDLSAASLDDVKSFFRQYYVPNNAVLVLSGDVDEKQARAWIDKYFTPFARDTAINLPNMPEPKLNGEIRKTYDEPGIPLPRVIL